MNYNLTVDLLAKAGLPSDEKKVIGRIFKLVGIGSDIEFSSQIVSLAAYQLEGGDRLDIGLMPIIINGFAFDSLVFADNHWTLVVKDGDNYFETVGSLQLL